MPRPARRQDVASGGRTEARLRLPGFHPVCLPPAGPLSWMRGGWAPPPGAGKGGADLSSLTFLTPPTKGPVFSSCLFPQLF